MSKKSKSKKQKQKKAKPSPGPPLPPLDFSTMDIDRCSVCKATLPALNPVTSTRSVFYCCGNSICIACVRLVIAVRESPSVSQKIGTLAPPSLIEAGLQGCCPLCHTGFPSGEEENHLRHLRVAKAGHGFAQYMLGKNYLRGEKGAQQNCKEAAFWFHKSARYGFRHAYAMLGELFHCPRLGLPLSLDYAMSCLGKAGLKDTKALTLLGENYEFGYGVEKDLLKAEEYYLLAVKDCRPRAISDYADLLEEQERWIEAAAVYERLAIKECWMAESAIMKERVSEAQAKVGHSLLKHQEQEGAWRDANLRSRAEWWLERSTQNSQTSATSHSYLDGRDDGRCWNCHEKRSKGKCIGCKTVTYCGRRCQANHWGVHRQECKEVRKQKRALEKSIEVACGHCGKVNPPSRCSRCKQQPYCDKDCQRIHWYSGHKADCKQPEPKKDEHEAEEANDILYNQNVDNEAIYRVVESLGISPEQLEALYG